MAGVDILATAFRGGNAALIADLYARWVSNPGAVDASFAELFAALNDEARAVLEDASGASWAPRRAGGGGPPGRAGPPGRRPSGAPPRSAGSTGGEAAPGA